MDINVTTEVRTKQHRSCRCFNSSQRHVTVAVFFQTVESSTENKKILNRWDGLSVILPTSHCNGLWGRLKYYLILYFKWMVLWNILPRMIRAIATAASHPSLFSLPLVNASYLSIDFVVEVIVIAVRLNVIPTPSFVMFIRGFYENIICPYVRSKRREDRKWSQKH